MNAKFIFSDVDGTLIDDNHGIQPKTKAALLTLIKAGVHFAIVSGRTPDAVYTVAKELGEKIPIVGYSGAIALTRDERIIFDRRLGATDTKTLIDVINSRYPAATINYYAGRDWYVENLAAEPIVKDMALTKVQAKEADFRQLLANNISPNKLMIMAEPTLCERMEREMSREFNKLSIVRSASHLLELMDGGINKAVGIEALLNHFGIAAADAIAFGDHRNDIEMLRFVGTGVAMGNAIAETKAAADEITADNNDEGIYKFLVKHGLVD